MNKLKEECIAQIKNHCRNSPWSRGLAGTTLDDDSGHVAVADIEGTGMWPVLVFMQVENNMDMCIRPDMGGRVSVCKYCSQLYWHYDPAYDSEAN